MAIRNDEEANAPKLGHLKIALVHDYLNQRGGAEKVVFTLSRMFPEAPVFTSVYDPRAMGEEWKQVDIRTTVLQRISPKLSVSKAYLPAYPLAFWSLDLSAFDIVLSSSSAFAKGVRTGGNTLHMCYCHTPARFLWQYGDYVDGQKLPPGARFALPPVAALLRRWDVSTSRRVDQFVAVSSAVSARISQYYRRDSVIIPPPVDLARYAIAAELEDYFLVLARLQSYKRINLAIEACNRLRVPLVVVGDGPDGDRLRKMAGPTVSFAGRVSESEAARLLSRCQALIWPGEEDFGLAPLEAQASGRPVIAFKAGGIVDILVEGVTGVFFQSQSTDDLAAAISRFRPQDFSAVEARRNAERFDRIHFEKRIKAQMMSSYLDPKR